MIFQILFNPHKVLIIFFPFVVYLNKINLESRWIKSINDSDTAYYATSFECFAGEFLNFKDLNFIVAKIWYGANAFVIHVLEMVKLYGVALDRF
ncbi:hypothetical protein A7Q10_10050 [Methylacidiphilum caldifontis]|uniref:Uncharacterized protein n=1 Tax=Methylacidiphilum caldifontis TaxID=2795386 RepID=A0A4Y8PBJ6_9BACT|nr:hypothetical protein A7Q10_10050 [Methylacidiphilum caldifontis]